MKNKCDFRNKDYVMADMIRSIFAKRITHCTLVKKIRVSVGSLFHLHGELKPDLSLDPALDCSDALDLTKWP